MNKFKKLAALSMLFFGKSLFSAEEMVVRAKREHEQVTSEDRSEEPASKKSRIQKTVRWKEENEEFIIPGRKSKFFIDGEQIDLPLCLEQKTFNGIPLTEEEISLLSNDLSYEEETETEYEDTDEDYYCDDNGFLVSSLTDERIIQEYAIQPVHTTEITKPQSIIKQQQATQDNSCKKKVRFLPKSQRNTMYPILPNKNSMIERKILKNARRQLKKDNYKEVAREVKEETEKEQKKAKDRHFAFIFKHGKLRAFFGTSINPFVPVGYYKEYYSDDEDCTETNE
ncbi:hypothetical protein K9K77_00970 [Candidatus Babeliales bacterium]|nr:hypothetical protein [Candidatus Babeliales bacterium]